MDVFETKKQYMSSGKKGYGKIIDRGKLEHLFDEMIRDLKESKMGDNNHWSVVDLAIDMTNYRKRFDRIMKGSK